MDSKNFVPVSGLNDLSESALLTARSLISAAKNVKIYRSQCDELSRRCLDLASALRDHSQGLEGTPAQQAIDEVERVLRNILKKVHKWADLGKMKSFVQQTEIRLGLDESYRELQSCSVRFNIALHLHASHRNNELEEIRRRDHHELAEMIKKVLRDKQLLKMELASSTPEAAQGVVQAIEQGLAAADVEESQEQQLREDFGELRRWVERLPPMDDLSGKVVLTNTRPISTGGSQDIYTGEWTGQTVALACPRNQSHAEQERFRRQVEIWRTLRHPNILPLLGIANIDELVYSVSPYLEFGNALGYLKCHPEADRVFLLREIASATEYLHMHGIIHGDLQGSNILISEDGHACLGDFGSARVEEGSIPEAPTYGGIRWIAPELISARGYVPTTRATDVWSFGMLCIEVFTENVPYSEVTNEMFIPVVIGKGSPPQRPGNSATARGLSDAMWDLMNQCWQLQPTSRPSMTKIREVIQNMHPLRSTSGSGISSSSIPHSGSHRDSCSSALASSCVVPSFTSKSSTAVNLTPSSTSLPLPNPSIPDGDSVSFRRPLPPLPPPLRAEILRGMPLSSSPPSQPGELSPDPRSIPSTSNSSSFVSSPLFHGSQSSNLTTPLGSLKSPTLINDDHLDGPSNPLSPLVLRVPSNPNSSLLLEPIDLTASLHRAKLSASSSIYSAETLLTSNTPRSLLDIAVRDTERVLRRSADGTVEAGTLEGLVDRLLKETHDRARDDEVKRIFLATYRLFTTDENLFRILKRRFEESGVSDTPSPLGSIRYSTLLFLRTWLRGDGENMGRELLTSIRQFTTSVDGSDAMNAVLVAQEIIKLVGEKMNRVLAPLHIQQSQPSLGSSLTLDKVKAVDIALSLSMIEGDIYGKITQADYIAHLREAPMTRHIECATRLNNRVDSWVKKKILGPEDVHKRAGNFQRFVQVAEECRKLRNFSSMSTIMMALQSATRASSTSSQLILTRDSKLSKSEKQLLRQLEDILDPLCDHRKYHEALQDIKSSTFTIPWLAVHLRGLKAYCNMHNAVVMIDQRPLINFSRCARLLERIDQVRRYRASPELPAKHRESRVLAWVKKELEDTPSDIPRETFEARVAELAEKERRMRDSRELELRSLGLRTAPPQTSHQRRPSASSSSTRSPVSRIL